MNKKFARAYNKIYKNKRYDLEALALSKILKGKTVLDVGCGTGLHAKELIKLGFDVEGIEPDEELYKQSSKIMRVHNVKVEDSEIQKTYDNVICMFQVMNYVFDAKSVLHRIHSLMNKKGILVIDMLTKESKLKEKVWVWDWLYTRRMTSKVSGNWIWVDFWFPFLRIEESFQHTTPPHDKLVAILNSCGFTVNKIIFNSMDNLVICTAE